MATQVEGLFALGPIVAAQMVIHSPGRWCQGRAKDAALASH